MRAVRPDTGAPESELATDQLEYSPLPVAHYVDSTLGNARIMLTRWKLNDVERIMIARGEDVYVSQLVGESLFHPIGVCVGPGGWKVD